MAFVQFSKVSLAFGDRDILKSVSLNLQAGSKAALTGANGSGKSTLIKVMAGLIEPDSGEKASQKGVRISYLPQSGLVHSGCTLMEEADKAFDWGYEIQRRIDSIGDELKSNPSNSNKLISEQSDLISHLENSSWHRREALIESVLLGLGFTRLDFSKRTEDFSGGWQMRIALAKALMKDPDILLLDEPTNYLDLEARSWLERFLLDFKGGFLLVSHDRYFLDHTINEVYELFLGELKRYSGNFSHYEEVRQIELKSLISSYEQQEKEIQHLEEFIKRFGYKATKASQAQEREKMLARLLENRIEIPENLKKIHFTFPEAPHSGRLVLTLDSLCKNYGGPDVIHDLSLVIESGERLVVAGRNGSGKSTLLRIIAGFDSSFTGNMKLGTGVSIGYFSQDSAEKISGSETILERLERTAPLELVPHLRDMLGSFLFRGDDVFKSIDVLSGGEKSRIALLELLLRPVNLLVLDEPTNHLDMHSKDVLLDALKSFGGTVVFVSHDRGFIEDLSTKVLELKPGSHREFSGDYRYYIERIESEAQKTNEEKPVQKKIEEKSSLKFSWEEQKKKEAEKRKVQKEADRLEAMILELEEKKAELEKRLSLPEVYSNGEKSKAVQLQIEEITSNLEEMNQKWLEKAEALESL